MLIGWLVCPSSTFIQTIWKLSPAFWWNSHRRAEGQTVSNSHRRAEELKTSSFYPPISQNLSIPPNDNDRTSRYASDVRYSTGVDQRYDVQYSKRNKLVVAVSWASGFISASISPLCPMLLWALTIRYWLRCTSFPLLSKRTQPLNTLEASRDLRRSL